MSKGTVVIRDLCFDCIIGILPHERISPQPLLLDVDMVIDFSDSIASENVVDTVDYAEISAALEQIAVDGQFQLVETFAAKACAHVIEHYSRVEQVKMTVKKPQAVANTAFVGVELVQQRS